MIIRNTLSKESLTIPQLVRELEQGCGTEQEIRTAVQSMLENGVLGLDREMKLYVKDFPEGATVQGTINAEGDWEPMISIPISEYEELLEFKAMYEDLCK